MVDSKYFESKSDQLMNFTNTTVLLSQKFVYLKIGSSEFMICGDLEVIQKGFSLFVCWSVSDHQKPILQTTKKKNGENYQIIYESYDVKTALSIESSPFIFKRSKLIDYTESYIVQNGLCVFPLYEAQEICFHCPDYHMSLQDGLTFDELLASTSYINFKKLNLNFCYLSSDQDAQLFFKVLNSSFWLKKTSDSEIYVITNIDDFITSNMTINNDYISIISQTLFTSSNNIFDILLSISQKTSLPSSLMDFLIPQDEENENILSMMSIKRDSTSYGQGYAFEKCFDERGRLESLEFLKAKVFEFGVSDNHRLVAYKYILGYYDPSMTLLERESYDIQKREEYYKIKIDAENAISSPSFEKLSMYYEIISKDIPRCDRYVPFYKGSNNKNLASLEEILRTYTFYNYKIGYDQSMTDLLSPLFYFIQDKAETFWCFAHMMKYRKKFEINSEVKFYNTMCKLVLYTKFFFPQFFIYTANDLFYISAFFGRLKLDFKRDFTLDETLRVWEVIWTQNMVKDYCLFLCLSYINKLCLKNDYRDHEFVEITRVFTKYTLGKSAEVIHETNQIIYCIKNEPNIPKFIKDSF